MDDSNEELSDQPSRKHPYASAKISEDSNNISTNEEGQPPPKQARQMADEDHQVELLILLWAFIVIWLNSNYIFLEYDTGQT